MYQGGNLQESIAELISVPLDKHPHLFIAGLPLYLSGEATILAILAGIVTWVAISDLRTMRIPNTASAAIVALWVIWAFVYPNAYPIYSLAIGIALFISGAILFHFNLMGGGDVKFLAALGLFAGPHHTIFFLLYASVFGGLLCILGILQNRQWFAGLGISLISEVHGKRTVPYGVAIAASAYITIASLWPV